MKVFFLDYFSTNVSAFAGNKELLIEGGGLKFMYDIKLDKSEKNIVE